MQTLYLYRGIPGSGKSTAAYKNPHIQFIFEADDYFKLIGEDLAYFYQFDSELLNEAHRHCLWKTKTALLKGYGVAVANTFTRIWEMQPYLDFAKANFINVVVYRCTGQYQNIHNVPKEKVEVMKCRMQDYEGEIFI